MIKRDGRAVRKETHITKLHRINMVKRTQIMLQPHKQMFRGENVTMLEWPINRPDLNPTENVWGCITDEINQKYRVDQKVLKLVAYLLKYTMELYQTYTGYASTISWFVSVVRMMQYARRYITSSFDDVMQQWPGVKNVQNCLVPAKCNQQHLCFMWQSFYRDYNRLDVAS